LAAARALLAGAVAGGLKRVVFAPGSRSAPLVYAAMEAAGRGELELTVRTDERVAGFTALGMAAATGEAAAVVTTSGTAVANLHPAVMEAAASRLPLLAITADRPAELHGVGANQTTDQREVFGSAPVWEATIAAGADDRSIKREGRRAVAAALGRASGLGGPAHLNIQFRDPLAPGPDWGDELRSQLAGVNRADDPSELHGRVPVGMGRAQNEFVDARDGGSWPEKTGPGVVGCPRQTGPGPGRRPGEPEHDAGELLPVVLEKGPRTVVVAGFGAGAAARELAEAAGWPLLAEPASGSWAGPNAITAGRLVAQLLADGIERVVAYGRPVLSRPVATLVQDPRLEVVIVHHGGGPWFDLGRQAGQIASRVVVVQEPGRPGQEERDWLEAWQTAGREVWRQLQAAPWPNGPAIANVVARAQGPLVVGASSAIRDLDLTPAPAGEKRVLAMRGLAGIDGTVSFAGGVAAALKRQPTLPAGPESRQRLDPSAAGLGAAREGSSAGRPTRDQGQPQNRNQGQDQPGGAGGDRHKIVLDRVQGQGEHHGQPQNRHQGAAATVLLGDLALAHDAGGLIIPELEDRPDIRIVVLQDRGGAIFENLEVAAPELSPAFERFFATPVSVDLESLARATGASFAEARTLSQLEDALSTPPHGISLVGVPLERARRRGFERQIVELSRNALGPPRNFPAIREDSSRITRFDRRRG
jgi:2-succinyl-5-enolpyruvyl-6-hydroxy-3-cyclohexene-1-carboxylate synthase